MTQDIIQAGSFVLLQRDYNKNCVCILVFAQFSVFIARSKLNCGANGKLYGIRNLNNAVMGFWTVQRGLIRQFFTHNTYNLTLKRPDTHN
jgi:hypothetical protein